MIRNDNDGTHCPARTFADNAAESIRALNHLTQRAAAEGLSPADVDQIVAALSQAADRLPQLLRQIIDLLRDRQQAGRLRVDQSAPLPDPESIIEAAADALQQASRHAVSTGRAMNAAHQGLAHLAARMTPSPRRPLPALPLPGHQR